jgi:hypothetical protein
MMFDQHRQLQTGVPPASLQATTSYLPCKLLGATKEKMFCLGVGSPDHNEMQMDTKQWQGCPDPNGGLMEPSSWALP